MALFLIVGLSDCPYFAQLEHDFHHVQSRVPEMTITKRSFLDHEDFQDFKSKERSKVKNSELISLEGPDSKLPLVLREYSNINGASKVIGGFSEAREYLSQYYGYNQRMCTDKMVEIAKENFDLQTLESKKNFEISDLNNDNVVNISIFDTVDENSQISYHFVPLLIQYLEKERKDIDQEKFILHINIIYSYSDSKALALKMELEDCSYKSLANISLFKADPETFEIPDAKPALQEKILKSKYVFIFENYKVCEKLSFHRNTKILVHLVGESEMNLNLEELNFYDQQGSNGNSGSNQKHEMTISTAAFTYENVLKSILARQLSGAHAGQNNLDIRSVQITNLRVYGKVGLRNKWQVDLSDCCIRNLENSAITLEGQQAESFTRSLHDIIIDKKFIESNLQKLADDRILDTPKNKRLVSESKACLSGFSVLEQRINSHFITPASNGMALPHIFNEKGTLTGLAGVEETEINYGPICAGLEGIKNEAVRNDVVRFNSDSTGESSDMTTTEGEGVLSGEKTEGDELDDKNGEEITAPDE